MPIQSIPLSFNCSLCGDGYADYSQLSKHESERHNFKCNSCEESFMVETDLGDHVATKHESQVTQCDECGLTVKSEDELDRHKKEDHNTLKTSTLTNENQAMKERMRQLELKLVQKNEQMEYVNQNLKRMEAENISLRKNNDELKKEKMKTKKDNDLKVKEVANQLNECREEVLNYVDMNTTLKEQNKVLKDIKEARDILQGQKAPEVVELESESSDISDKEAVDVYRRNMNDTGARSKNGCTYCKIQRY